MDREPGQSGRALKARVVHGRSEEGDAKVTGLCSTGEGLSARGLNVSKPLGPPPCTAHGSVGSQAAQLTIGAIPYCITMRL